MAAAARAGSKAGAYVALSPGSFSDQSAGDIDASATPWWFIASRDERFAQAVVAGIPDVSRTAEVTIVSGNAHASDILSPHFILNDEIADWFAARLRGAHALGRASAWPVRRRVPNDAAVRRRGASDRRLVSRCCESRAAALWGLPSRSGRPAGYAGGFSW